MNGSLHITWTCLTLNLWLSPGFLNVICPIPELCASDFLKYINAG